ncbi:MAG: UDP-N-acetylglucosamine 1-carboxyvinyltransferase [Cytophagales bacterium]|nr:UDP-N-acetylglucosamine 1-carboxyvinyltransferase [Armatimonadota bacterium]
MGSSTPPVPVLSPPPSRLVIVGGQRLEGEVVIGGSKNAALAILAGALLASEGETTLTNLPRIGDIRTMVEVLGHFGVAARFSQGDTAAHLDATRLTSSEAPADLVARMRASFWALGPILARCGEAKIAQPGGCNIGARPIDLHLKGLQALGAEIETGFGYVRAHAPKEGLKGASVYLDFASVGATMNIMMAASLAHGTTVIENAAQEPDVEDLGNFLNAMGARISGHGTGVLTVQGVDSLHAADYAVISDRMEAGTYGLMAGITGGNVFLKGANAAHLRPVTLKMIEAGMQVEEREDGIRCTGPDGRPIPTRITALPHPGFPTDMQQAFTAYLATADGTSVVTDQVYESRFRYLTELGKMGVVSQVDSRTAVITGAARLTGADVDASDLRAGAALVVAGLAAQGQTRISHVEHLDRGYEALVEKLQKIGAQVWREDEHGRRQTSQRKAA